MSTSKVCRFLADGRVRIGLAAANGELVDLTNAGVDSLESLFESPDPVGRLAGLANGSLPRRSLDGVTLRAPAERQEIWGAGVTYLRSKTARMEESDFSATAYDKVYDADRPEIFFKSLPDKVVTTGEPVGIRSDSRWSVPEPELALVFNSRGALVGQAVGNDMSSRDIEGTNLLYLPQAKTYHRSCAIGPWIALGAPEAEVRGWTIKLTIDRAGAPVFRGETSVANMKRSFAELGKYLFQSQVFPHGAFLLTGTGVVPADSFTLEAQDVIEIEISGIGSLRNEVVVV
jgi:2-dehydro-3-deoxy-D-arabinonate dehydratase